MHTEILDAIRARKRLTDYSMDLVKIAAGSKYRSDWKPAFESHENHAHEWRTNMVPNLVNGNPQAAGIRSGSLDDEDPALKGLTMAVNAWSHSADLGNLLLEHADDVQFNYCVGLVTTEMVPLVPGVDIERDAADGEKVGLRPRAHRISPWRFFADQQAINRLGRRYIGHIWIEDKKSLADEKLPDGRPAYDREALKSVVVDDEVRTLLLEIGIDIGGSGIDREQVVGYEFYVPETGMIYTMASTPTGPEKAGYLRAPRKWRGLRSGPYVMGGIYMLPDQTFPVAPLAIIHDLSLEVNRHRAQASDDAGRAKKVLVTDADAGAVGKMIASKNGDVLGIPGFKGNSMEVQLGGVNPDQLAYIQVLNDLVEKTVGLTANSSGKSTGDSATEADIIQRNRNGRVQWCQRAFRRFTEGMMRIAAEQFWNNPRTRQAINHTDPVTGEVTVGMYEGGDGRRLGIPFDQLQLTIDPYSTDPQDDAILQQQQQKAMELVIVNVETMKQNPQVKWKSLIGDTFDRLGMKNRADKYLDWEMLELMQAPIIIQAQMMAQQGAMMLAGGGAPGGVPAGPEGQAPAQQPEPTDNKKRVANEAQKRSAPLRLTG